MHLAPRAGGGLEGDGAEWEEGREDGEKVKMDQSAVLDNESDMTSNLLFHPYENVLVVADDFDGISVWNFEAGKKEKSFSNCNQDESR